MRRIGLLATLCLLVSAGAHAGSWSDLWLTPDQQGQRLLDAGHPGEAARRFRDPRRRAYADLKARRYTAAAKLLAPFKDPQSEYNRGNALARSGRLRAALDAYDAALKRASADRDIRHNRDLVAQALRKQQEKSRKPGAAGGRRQHDKPQAKPGRGSGQQHKGGGGTADHDKAARSRSHRQTGAGSQANEAAKAKTPGAAQQATNGAARSGHSRNRAHPSPATAAQAQQRQAKRDAAAAVHLRQSRAKTGSNDQTEPSGSTTASKGHGSKPPKPPTEAALSLDQWLRRIPDNPAGLLRRKFLIENALRQQRGQQP